jgi:hypothetical protein
MNPPTGITGDSIGFEERKSSLCQILLLEGK